MRKSILVAAIAVLGSSALFAPGAQASWGHHDHWGPPIYGNPAPVGYGYGSGYVNPYYTNNPYYGYGMNRRIRRDERRAIRHFDHRLNRWF